MQLDEQEHWQLDSEGEFEGLFTVNPFAAQGADFWSRLDVIIGAYAKIHPVEMETCIRENVELTSGNFTQFGEGKQEELGLRHRLRIPVGLIRLLERYAPEIFEQKKMYQEFLKHYPGLRVCETV